ncbi:MAG: hypothetical protein R2941_00360 [Desulfobacterales bacterium]
MIVLSRIAESEKNAPWLMFRAMPDKVEYGAQHYRWQSPVSGILNRLFEKYRIEGSGYALYRFSIDLKYEILYNIFHKNRIFPKNPVF